MGHHFTGAEFERAFRSFIELYAVRPSAALCSPDVLERFCALYERAGNAHRSEVRFDGVRMTAAILPPGTIAFEGEVDQDRMGDW